MICFVICRGWLYVHKYIQIQIHEHTYTSAQTKSHVCIYMHTLHLYIHRYAYTYPYKTKNTQLTRAGTYTLWFILFTTYTLYLAIVVNNNSMSDFH